MRETRPRGGSRRLDGARAPPRGNGRRSGATVGGRRRGQEEES
ncbi:hypothetical protein HMPREF1317_1247 [Schaalia georgiae F0490]|uniref:Uncharacterized protein n=1 Tax=Schaalia georgiae F0490 TaxID=1125717 RepID=J0N2X6_9ACTO|nr:hypothetical protein HMPREF1317_1247 [Schaalia georgiae F0490]